MKEKLIDIYGGEDTFREQVAKSFAYFCMLAIKDGSVESREHINFITNILLTV